MGPVMSSRPLIGVTTSEMRVAKSVEPTPQGEPPRKEMALGLAYLRAIEAAGGLPLVIPPMPSSGDQAAGRSAARHLPLGRAGSDPQHLRRRAACPSWGPPSRSSTASSWSWRARRTGGTCRSSRSAAGMQLLNVATGGTLIQHLPDVTDGTVEHRQPAPADQVTHVRGAGRRRASPPHVLGEARRRRELLPPPGHRPARPRPAGRRLVARRRGGGDRGARRATSCLGVQWHAECLVERPEQSAALRRAWSRRPSDTRRLPTALAA